MDFNCKVYDTNIVLHCNKYLNYKSFKRKIEPILKTYFRTYMYWHIHSQCRECLINDFSIEFSPCNENYMLRGLNEDKYFYKNYVFVKEHNYRAINMRGKRNRERRSRARHELEFNRSCDGLKLPIDYLMINELNEAYDRLSKLLKLSSSALDSFTEKIEKHINQDVTDNLIKLCYCSYLLSHQNIKLKDILDNPNYKYFDKNIFSIKHGRIYYNGHLITKIHNNDYCSGEILAYSPKISDHYLDTSILVGDCKETIGSIMFAYTINKRLY